MLCDVLKGKEKEETQALAISRSFSNPFPVPQNRRSLSFPRFWGKFRAIHLFRIYSSSPSHFCFLSFPLLTSFRTGFLLDPNCGPQVKPKNLHPPFKIPRECRVMLSFEPSCLGGRHITAFGVPKSRKNWDRPATIRDSSRFFTVGSKILASSPTSQGTGFPGLLLDFRINHRNQPARPGFNTLTKIFLSLYRFEIVVGNVQRR